MWTLGSACFSLWFVRFQLSQDHVVLVENELKCGHDAATITQNIAAVLLVDLDQDSSNENVEKKQFLMGIETR